MAQSNFKVGDIVRLKSGSPDMTINEIATSKGTYSGREDLKINKVRAQWFVNTTLHSGDFTEPQLEKVEKTADEYFS
ncbi:hypothetical protein BA768_19555 [Chryseobacterium sp. CBo1]|uniref:YodC family protein n=1 Tax=Chryseobacterium sp. CBo1 TaxID=1869230 RepID=UPI0008105A3F|nr:DUF2158 domain-containing protein [Chryseobacterium sp. CBo1]OCK50627.1 hypothetical protein BA768_19555 [Chryseobacterium sp. CBo1]